MYESDEDEEKEGGKRLESTDNDIRYLPRRDEENTSLIPLRLTLLVVILAISVISVYQEHSRGRGRCWAYTLSAWNLILEDLYFMIAVFEAIGFSLNAHRGGGPRPRVMGLASLLRGIVYPLSFFDAIIFWAYSKRYEHEITLISPFTHGCTAVVALTDGMFSPGDDVHYVQAFYFGTMLLSHFAWCIFHFYLKIGNCQGDRTLYPSVRWNEPISTGVIAAFICTLLAICLDLALLWLRLHPIPSLFLWIEDTFFFSASNKSRAIRKVGGADGGFAGDGIADSISPKYSRDAFFPPTTMTTSSTMSHDKSKKQQKRLELTTPKEHSTSHHQQQQPISSTSTPPNINNNTRQHLTSSARFSEGLSTPRHFEGNMDRNDFEEIHRQFTSAFGIRVSSAPSASNHTSSPSYSAMTTPYRYTAPALAHDKDYRRRG